MPNCTGCGREIYDWERHYYDSFQICSDCYRRRFSAEGKNLLCTKCLKRMNESDVNRSLGVTLCRDCYKKELQRREEWVCASCRKEIKQWQKKFKGPDGKTLCEDCARKGFAGVGMAVSVGGKCDKCGKPVVGIGLPLDEKRVLCKDCAIEYMRDKKKRKEGLGERLKHFIGK